MRCYKIISQHNDYYNEINVTVMNGQTSLVQMIIDGKNVNTI